MRYLLDTNIWSYIQEGHGIVTARISELPDDATLFMSVVNQGELLGGIQVVLDEKRRAELTRLYQQVIAIAADILPVDSRTAEKFADVYCMLRRKGKPIDTNDMWIAAIALANDLILVSNDRHFANIDGLRIEDWTKTGGTAPR